MAITSKKVMLRIYTVVFCALLSCVGAQLLDENVVEYTIVEEQAVNTLIGNIITDSGLDTRYPADTLSQFSYQFLSPSSQHKAYFEIEENSGLLRTAQSIDRDEICARRVTCDVRLDISIKPVQYFQIIKVTIRIRDINDNWPTYPEDRVSLDISETTAIGATFALPSAEDADSGAYGIQGYRLQQGSGSENFGLQVTNNSDGSIDVHLVLKARLDRETTSFHSLRMLAWDGGIPQKSGSVMIDVKVMDANDNNPRFTNSTYEVSIFENQLPGTTIARVRAVDDDDGDNAEITYSFNRNSESLYGHIIGIRHATGEVYLKSEVSFEDNPTFHIGLVATDQGPNSLAAYAKIVIHVWDVNDHAPEITVNSLTVSGHAQISENAAVGSFVAHISVVDVDSGMNGEFSCSLNSDHFQLMQMYDTEFKLVTSVTFDREQIDEYHANLVCRDLGSTPQTATEHITVKIMDENDHDPVFASDSYTVIIPENNRLGSTVLQMNVTDADVGENARIQWSIHSMNGHSGSMDIHRDQGRVTANVVLDHEKHEEYMYVIMATDSGEPKRSATATLTVKVKDVNDEPPNFPQRSYSFGTFENQAANTEIGIVTAYDADDPPFNEVTYMFDPSRDDSEAFSIHPLSGKITARRMLDREEKAEYRLVVIAKNYGYSLSSSVDVTVQVADKNDNAPRISYPSADNYTVEIASVARHGDFVAKVKAADLDIGSNSAVSYSLPVGNGEQLFDINPRSGGISVNRDLRDHRDKTIHLTVLVQDSGVPQLSSIADLDIFINGSAAAAQIYGGEQAIDDNVIIIVTATLFAVILVLGILIIVFLLRRRRERRRQHQKYNCRVEATKVLMAANEDNKKTAMIKNNLDRENGKSNPRKEVTFSADSLQKNGYPNNAPWPSVIDPSVMQNPQTHSSVICNNSLPRSRDGSLQKHHQHQQPPPQRPHTPRSSQTHLPPRDCRFREEPRHTLLYDQRKGACKDNASLTEMQLQVHDMLQMLHQDHSSDRGSLTDSGRGASEEGDANSRPSPTAPAGDKSSRDRDWKGHGYSSFVSKGDKQPGVAVKVNPHCPKHGRLAADQSRSGSFNNASPPQECAKSTNSKPSGGKRPSYPEWPARDAPAEPQCYKPHKSVESRQYLTPEDLLPPREVESVDGMSDSGTTTSGSYVVDLDEVEEELQGPQISADIIV